MEYPNIIFGLYENLPMGISNDKEVMISFDYNLN